MYLADFQLPLPGQVPEGDSVLLGDGRRYFHTGDSREVQDLESAVLESPRDVQLWLKLANSKLNNPDL